ncbi:ATP-binding protein [Streptomyces sp. NPDC096310]|uniref:ATP-binding protein n=1 Tax=Streptomyces sp. NPDC096310 TaxID=3366082 RepID=UPI00381540ED
MQTVSPHWAYTLQLPPDPRAPGIARGTVRSVVRAHRMDEVADTAELLASELVTNAYRHAPGPSALRIRALEPHRLRVGVWDSSPEIPPPFNGGLLTPSPSAPGTEALPECGRGLRLVQLYADDWGAYRLGGERSGHRGKLLWVECVLKGGQDGPAGQVRGAASAPGGRSRKTSTGSSNSRTKPWRS